MEKIKQDFRREMRLKKAHFFSTTSSQERADFAQVLWTRVEQDPAFVQARTLLLYSALPDEVPTEDFLRRWSTQKQLVLPRVSGDILLLKRYSPDALEVGYMGVMEPSEDAENVPYDAIDCAIVPGLAFTPQGYRMGRGKAYYDRLLPLLTKAVKISVAFPYQVCEQLPLDPWDKPVDVLYF